MWGGIRRLGGVLLSAISGERAEEGDRPRWPALTRFERIVRVTAFWLAVVLPFLYLPLLFSGLGSQSEAVGFGGLLVTHVVALSLGHSHVADRE